MTSTFLSILSCTILFPPADLTLESAFSLWKTRSLPGALPSLGCRHFSCGCKQLRASLAMAPNQASAISTAFFSKGESPRCPQVTGGHRQNRWQNAPRRRDAHQQVLPAKPQIMRVKYCLAGLHKAILHDLSLVGGPPLTLQGEVTLWPPRSREPAGAGDRATFARRGANATPGGSGEVGYPWGDGGRHSAGEETPSRHKKQQRGAPRRLSQ